jgi:hypothetical protein
VEKLWAVATILSKQRKNIILSLKKYIYLKIIIINEEHIRQLNQKSFLKLKGKI